MISSRPTHHTTADHGLRTSQKPLLTCREDMRSDKSKEQFCSYTHPPPPHRHCWSHTRRTLCICVLEFSFGRNMHFEGPYQPPREILPRLLPQLITPAVPRFPENRLSPFRCRGDKNVRGCHGFAPLLCG